MSVARILVMPEMLGTFVALKPQAIQILGSLESTSGVVALLLEGPGIPAGATDVTMVFKHEPGRVTAEIRAVTPPDPGAVRAAIRAFSDAG